MSDTPRLFDSGLLTRRRARARATGPADFLHAAAAGEISERLFEVNRRFQAAALVTPRPEIWCETLAPNGLGEIRTVPDADVLELAPGAHDLVIHGLCLHWANDPVGQLIQARRALRPDGLLIAVLFGGDTLSELRAALAEAEAEVSGGISPRVAPMGEIRALGGLLQRAGLALPVADGVRLHPVCTPRFIDEAVLPAVSQGAHRAGRPVGAVEICMKPLIGTAPDRGALAHVAETVRARVAFYLSTPSYRRAFEIHGWGDIAIAASELARQRRWEELPGLVDDEMLHTVATVGTYDEIAGKLRERYRGRVDRIEFSIPVRSQDDAERFRVILDDVRR